MKTFSKFIFVFLIAYNSKAYAQILVSGSVRNDAVFTYYDNENEFEQNKRFDDILENKLILRYETDYWRYYADGRLYLYYGDIRDTEEEYEVKLMRSFIRYSPAVGDFTLGKTYINLGNPGLFNPFEINKQVIMSDLAYDKEGILALEFVLPIGDLSGIKTFTGTYESESENDNAVQKHNKTGGMSIWTNALNFDFGAVAARVREDSNIGGLYMKGDLLLGVQGAYAFHTDDEFHKPKREANFGLDYSFFEAHLIISSMFYYNQAGAKRTEDYAISPDGYFYAKYYLYSNITVIWDEFLSGEVSSFINLIDNSSVIYPSVKYLIADGLSITAAAYFYTGKDEMEYSRDTAGIVNTLVRVEAKF